MSLFLYSVCKKIYIKLKKKRCFKIPKKKDDEDDDDENEDNFQMPFDFFKFLQDPNKMLKSKEFQRIFQKVYEKLIENLPPEFKNISPEKFQKEFIKNKGKFKGGPFMYGFNVNFDSEGKPTFDSFGNIKSEAHGRPKVDDVREPLVEITEEEDQIIVIAEMPGVLKEDIELKSTTNSLTISTNNQNLKGPSYYKEIELPSSINSDYAKARYQNGILEIKLKKIDEKHTNIKID
ncbi:MAG: Hsp20/alpha crystallin family protein [Candidatus Lokiarchaeota archaeon]|nr:Hsp20/alpha crystallin family protein [Candidatus Lokiarchaeota archaeon]